jgi:uncharacterized phage protein gp47/JayE
MAIITPFIDATGFNLPTLNDVFNSIVTSEQVIYGTDTNYDSNSPDGQRVLILAQALIDSYEAQQSLFNSYFLDYAQGRALDMVVGRKNIQRKGGTFSTILIQIVTNALCTLQGLDGNINDVNGTGYIVQDNIGNQWILTATTTIPANTTVNLLFRSATYGVNLANPNTITISLSVVVGVVSVTNPNEVLTIGSNEETDTALRIRAFQSYAFSSQNQVDAVYSQLLNLAGVTDVLTWSNNNTSPVDSTGTPIFTLWTIVEGGDNTAIANIIYQNIHGSGMRGTVSVTIPSINGIASIVVKFDRPIYIPLYIKFNLKQTVFPFTFNILGIQNYIINNINYKLGVNADSGTLTSIALDGINSLGGGGVPLNLQISNNNTNWHNYLALGSLQEKFSLSTANININVV